MPSKVIPGKLNRAEAVLLGYGYHRAEIDEPWYGYADVLAAMSSSPLPVQPVNVSRISQGFVSLAKHGYAEQRNAEWLGPGRGRPVVEARITEDGIDALCRSLVYSVAKASIRKSLEEVLIIPKSIDTVLRQGQFTQQLLGAVVGDNYLRLKQEFPES